MNKLSKKSASTFLFTLLTSLLILIAFVSYIKIKQYDQSVSWFIKSNLIKTNLDRVFSNLKDAETGQRGYLLSNDTLYLEPYHGAGMRINSLLLVLDSLTKDNLIQQMDLNNLKLLIDERINLLESNLIMYNSNPHNKISDEFLIKGRIKMNEVRNLVNKMMLEEHNLMEQRELIKDRSAFFTPFYLLLLSLFSIFIITLFFFRLQKETNMRISSEETERLLEDKVKKRTAQLNERNSFVETILETSKEYIAVYAKDFTLMSLNKATENLMGKKREDVIGKKLLELFPAAQGTKAETDLQSAFEGNTVYNPAYQSPVTGRYIENYITPLKDTQSNIYAALAIANDVTDISLKQIEIESTNKQLQLQNKIFEHAEQVAKMGSYKWNISTGDLIYSANLFRLLDNEPNEFVPSFEKFLSFIHPDDLEEVIKNGEQTLQTGVLVETPYRIITKSGIIKYFRSSGSFSDDNGNRILIGTVQDLTKDIEASQELQIKNRELEKANYELASFSFVASHDLKEPLRKIQTYSKRINEEEFEKLSEKGKDYFNRLYAASERMQNLIESVSILSNIQTRDIVFVQTDLNKTLMDVLEDLKDFITKTNTVVESQDLPTLNAVPIQMHQLFLNLIGNAIKYSKPNVAPHIKITAENVTLKETSRDINKEANFWKISFQDNGIGFEQQYENKIFELFQRLHHKDEYEGTGIGLAICKKIVSTHNGKITVIGQRLIGATFNIFLPS